MRVLLSNQKDLLQLQDYFGDEQQQQTPQQQENEGTESERDSSGNEPPNSSSNLPQQLVEAPCLENDQPDDKSPPQEEERKLRAKPNRKRKLPHPGPVEEQKLPAKTNMGCCEAPTLRDPQPLDTTAGDDHSRDPAHDGGDDSDQEDNEASPEVIHVNNSSAVAATSGVASYADTGATRHKSCNDEGDDDTMAQFRRTLQKDRNFEIVEQEGDGNCLFRAVSLQVYGDASMHLDVRKQCLDFMAADKQHFSHFIQDETFENYIARKQRSGVHGNNPEIQAISELFNRPMEVFTPATGSAPLNIFQSDYKTSDVPIRLSYHDNHYDAVVDPLLPTAGLGLGIGVEPGLADKMQLQEAFKKSEHAQADQQVLDTVMQQSHADALQRVIKESVMTGDVEYTHGVMQMSDMEATNFDMEQAVLESSLHGMAHAKQPAVNTSTINCSERNSVAAAASKPASTDTIAAPAASSPAITAAASIEAPVAASLPPPAVASVARAATDDAEYPPTVQELVMNGFPLQKVVHAYELIGDNFDDLLAFLMSSTT